VSRGVGLDVVDKAQTLATAEDPTTTFQVSCPQRGHYTDQWRS